MLEIVRIPDAARRLRAYPFELSGGMRQRVMIALAMLCSPELLIADEPTTALDVTVQAQVLKLLQGLKRHTGAAIVLITHDLAVVAGLSDRVMIMYAGRAVETGHRAGHLRRPAPSVYRGPAALGTDTVRRPGAAPADDSAASRQTSSTCHRVVRSPSAATTS